MDHADHVNLLRDGIPAPGGIWADLGSGRGAFTLALADLIGAGGTIFSIDRDRHALDTQKRRVERQFPTISLHTRVADFNHPQDLPALDGVVMANCLHFQRDPLHAVRLVISYLKPGGRLLLVEYNIRRGNFAVPYPLPYDTWVEIAKQAGFVRTRLMASRPSSTMGEIYSACSLSPAKS